MDSFINGLLVGIAGGVVAGVVMTFIIKQKNNTSTVEHSMNEDEQKKAENLRKIEEFIADKEKFTNNDLEHLLGVSDTTIGRYLDELESTGKITQVGDIGSGVYYTKAK